MENKTLNYSVWYFHPGKELINQVTVVNEIRVNDFNPNLPKEFVGYEITYGTGKSYRNSINSYCAYRGKVISFSEAVQNFSYNIDFGMLSITKKMVDEGISTEKLQKTYTPQADLKDHFKTFLSECKKLEISDNPFEQAQNIIQPIGVIVAEPCDQLFLFYPNDVVVN